MKFYSPFVGPACPPAMICFILPTLPQRLLDTFLILYQMSTMNERYGSDGSMGTSGSIEDVVGQEKTWGRGLALYYVNHTQVLVVIKVDNDFFFGFCRIRAFETPCFTASDTD